MKTLIQRCKESIRQEVLKDLKGKLVSQIGTIATGYCILNEQSGKYRVIDVAVSIQEKTIWNDDGMNGIDFTEIQVTLIAETLKAKKLRCFKYDILP